MAVVIRMMRAGARKRPFYRIVAADSRRQRDGRFLEILGHYDPMAKPYTVKLEEERIRAWIANGAQPSTQAASLLREHGIVAARPSRPQRAAAAGGARAVKRAKPRRVSPRRVKARATRAKKRAAAAKGAGAA